MNYLRRHHWGIIGTFIALSGTAYAAVNLPNNSVGSGEIKSNAVRAAEVARGSIGSSEARNGSLRCADLASAVCREDGLDNVTVRSASAVVELVCYPNGTDGKTCVAPDPVTVTALCGAGERAVAGGWEGSLHRAPSGIVHSQANVDNVDRPFSGSAGVPVGWTARGTATGDAAGNFVTPANPTFTVYAVCAD